MGGQSWGGRESNPLRLPMAGVQVRPILTLSTPLARRPPKATGPVTRCHTSAVCLSDPVPGRLPGTETCSHPGSSPGQPSSASCLPEGPDASLAVPPHPHCAHYPRGAGRRREHFRIGWHWAQALPGWVGWRVRVGLLPGPLISNRAPCDLPPSRSLSRRPVISHAPSLGPCQNIPSPLACREGGQPRGDRWRRARPAPAQPAHTPGPFAGPVSLSVFPGCADGPDLWGCGETPRSGSVWAHRGPEGRPEDSAFPSWPVHRAPLAGRLWRQQVPVPTSPVAISPPHLRPWATSPGPTRSKFPAPRFWPFLRWEPPDRMQRSWGPRQGTAVLPSMASWAPHFTGRRRGRPRGPRGRWRPEALAFLGDPNPAWLTKGDMRGWSDSRVSVSREEAPSPSACGGPPGLEGSGLSREIRLRVGHLRGFRR